MERTAGSTLFPIYDEEVLLKGGIVVAKKGGFAGAGSSMQENKRRIGLGYAAKPDALGYAADIQGFHCRDAVRNDAAIRVLEWGGMNAASEQEKRCNGCSAADENEACRFLFIDGIMMNHETGIQVLPHE